MIALKVDNKKYELVGDPTIAQWQALMKWDFNDFSQWPFIINAVTGVPFETINEMEYEQKRLAVVMIAHSITERRAIPLPDFNGLEFGQWIDMEYYIAQGVEKSISDIIKSLGIETGFAQEALYATERYLEWRENIYKQYSALFSYDEPDLEELAEQTKQTPTEIAKAWYNILVDLAGENVLNIKGVTELGIREALNFMATRKEKQLEEIRRARQKQINTQNDIQRSRR